MKTTQSRGRLLTIPEVAERLRFHQGHIRRLISAGKLSVVRLSAKALRVAELDLEAFIEKRRKAAGT